MKDQDEKVSDTTRYYRTFDVNTIPQTEIYIRLRSTIQSTELITSLPNDNNIYYIIDEKDLEDSLGWKNVLNSNGIMQLSICFMHSFGKCLGSKNNGPLTCNQIHVRRDIIDLIRNKTIFNTREYFLNKLKVYIPDKFKPLQNNKQKLKFEFFEFRIKDVEITNGLISYDLAFRNWLEKSTDPQFLYKAYLCSKYPRCNAGQRCPHIHALIENTISRDQLTTSALSKIQSQLSKNPKLLKQLSQSSKYRKDKNTLSSSEEPIPSEKHRKLRNNREGNLSVNEIDESLAKILHNFQESFKENRKINTYRAS